eukprot:323987_1
MFARSHRRVCLLKQGRTLRRFSNDNRLTMPRALFNLKNGISLQVAQGDLTLFNGDAVINAANESMLGGGGVDGAIHRAAGGELLQWIKENLPTVNSNSNIRCITGMALLTPGFNLNCHSIIHTVGPIYANHNNPHVLLRMCYDNCLRIATEHHMKSIAFPCLLHEGIEIAFESLAQAESQSLEEVWFVVFGQDMFEEAVNVEHRLFV